MDKFEIGDKVRMCFNWLEPAGRRACWVYGNDGRGNEHYFCSFCLEDALNDDRGEIYLSKYCPHCGAKMDEEGLK